MDPGIIFYSRSYKKIYAMISDIFPFLNLIYYLFRYLAYYIKISIIKRKLAENIFERKEISPDPLFIKRFEKINGKYLNNRNSINLKIENNIEKKYKRSSCFASGIKNENKLFLSNNQSNITLDAEKNIEILNKKELSALSKDNPNKAYVKQLKIKSPSDNNIKNKAQKTNEHLFPYFYFLMDFIFDKLINPKQFFCISKIYFTV